MSTPRTALVTGSTDGIGKATALALARAGLHVIVHGRSRPRVDRAIAELSAEVPGAQLDGVSFDLGSLASVRKGAAEVAARAPALHVLVNNAGIFAAERGLTGDGIETTLAVNHVGPYLLTHLLTPQLEAGAPARVIILSSIAHTRGRIHMDDLMLERAYSGYAAYAQSKLANVMHALDLAARHDPARIAVYCLHPGVISTKLLREGFGPVRGASTAQGAAMAIQLATAEQIDEPSGTYWSEGQVAPVSPAALDASVRDALRAATERLAGIGDAAAPGADAARDAARGGT
ncbi:MAG: SDR family oxidoreductase [Kofleriaceae bacterium]|nr:SDR family oxidoreductase [Kofleriaceae bacterium]MCL4227613.1 SDR family oxidoreductase [Myxococcales bacterium]